MIHDWWVAHRLEFHLWGWFTVGALVLAFAWWTVGKLYKKDNRND